MKRQRNILIAVGASGVLLLLLIGVRHASPPRLASRDWDAASIVRVEVSGARRAILERQGAAWTVAAPERPQTRYPADAGRITDALSSLTVLSTATAIPDASESPEDHGLDDAHAIRVRLVQEGGDTLELRLGWELSGGTALRSAASPRVFLHRSGVRWDWDRDLQDWRDRRLVPVAPADLAALELRVGDAPPLSLIRSETTGDWRLAEGTQVPNGYLLGPLEVDRLLAALTRPLVQDFLEGAAAAEATRRLDAGHDTVAVRLQDGRSVVLQLERPADERPPGHPAIRVEGHPAVYGVMDSTASELQKRLLDLRERRLLRFNPERVSRIKLQAGPDNLVVIVEKRQGTWTLVQPERLPDGAWFDGADVAWSLKFLSLKTEAERILPTALPEEDLGLAPPAALLELSEEGTTQTFRVGKHIPVQSGTSGRYARTSLDGLTYAISDSIVMDYLTQGAGLISLPRSAGGPREDAPE